MPNLTTQDLKSHVEANQPTFGELAKRLYDSMTYDINVPMRWVEHAARQLDIEYVDVRRRFVWIYPDGSIFGQPGPVDMRGVEILEELEELASA